MSNEVDAIYLPLPPALHYKWAKKALENDKHVFVEKPSTTNYQDSLNLDQISRRKKTCIARKLYVPISFTNFRNKEKKLKMENW